MGKSRTEKKGAEEHADARGKKCARSTIKFAEEHRALKGAVCVHSANTGQVGRMSAFTPHPEGRGFSADLSMKGAEAVLEKIEILGLPAVEKLRVEKKYRASGLDIKIRTERTRREARLLSKAKEAGALCPVVYQVGNFFIRMKFIKGKMLHEEIKGRELKRSEISEAAGILARLHQNGVIHGDFTPANLMLTDDGMAVIDFGLGSISTDDEDKATDVVTMKKAIGRKGSAFVKAYGKKGGKSGVVKLVSEIEKRARYMERG